MAFERAKRHREDTVEIYVYELSASAKEELQAAGWEVIDCKEAEGRWLIVAQP